MNTIQASELRIGNLVSIPNGQHSEILSIAEKSCYTKFGLHTYPFIGAIPLNEDWLVRFSFEKIFLKMTTIDLVFYKLGDIVVYLLEDSFEIEIITGAGQFNLFEQYYFVHQLQNIHHSIKGTELTLTDK